jgi:hypothetical protein
VALVEAPRTDFGDEGEFGACLGHLGEGLSGALEQGGENCVWRQVKVF